MYQPKIIIDCHIPYIKGVLDRMARVEYIAGNEIDRQAVSQADALIIRTRTHCNAALLEGSKVRFIATATIGYDHIDTEYCHRHHIAWTNAAGCNAASVAQYLLSALTAYSTAHRYLLPGKCLGVVGVGNVGTKVARIGEALGMKVLLNDPPRADREGEKGFVPLDTLVEEADIITFHTPLAEEGVYKTFHLADAAFFDKLKKKPLIINSSRGEVVDNAALCRALETGKVRDTIIDCWENEPHPLESLLAKAFIATPHIAGYSADGKANGSRMSAEAVARFFNLPALQKTIAPPPPPCPVIDYQSFEATILHTYPILDDSHRLKSDPSAFEHLRNHYPLRREAPAFTLRNVPTQESALLKSLGFQFV